MSQTVDRYLFNAILLLYKLCILYAVLPNTVGSKQQETVSLLTISSTSFLGSRCKQSSGLRASLLPCLCISVVLLPLAHIHTTTIKLIPLFWWHHKNSSDGLATAWPWLAHSLLWREQLKTGNYCQVNGNLSSLFQFACTADLKQLQSDGVQLQNHILICL